MWAVSDNELMIDGTCAASFSHKVKSAKQVEDTVLVVIDVPAKVIYSDNLFGYVLSEKRIWQIQLTTRLGLSAPDILVCDILNGPFDPNTARVSTWAGVTFVIDLLSGEILSSIDAK